jgi:hypothetical protein
MTAIIDIGPEVLIDRSRIRFPQLRLLLDAIGQPLVKGSAWVAVSKHLAQAYNLITRASRAA